MPQTTGQFSIDLTPGDPLHAGTGRGYVALEVFTGGVDGREGTFALQQFGTMVGGEASLTYVVAPGSGSGALAGLTGIVHLEVVEGVHEVRFEYEL